MDNIKDLERILTGHVEPRDLALQLLQEITEKFSDGKKIGTGGFGVVYKGELQNGIYVAVKRIPVSDHNLDDADFNNEVKNMMKIISHRNVVRFLGFCSNTHRELIKLAGSTESVFVQIRERLLCFEYISNGHLGKHITDELRGLDWSTRYDIINGVCHGLHYLHEEKNIIHMDLNPSNIMLDNDMVPKITDFGLSRPDKNTHISGTLFATLGYCAPEYEKHRKTSKKGDIYSLGVIIVELITGGRVFPGNNLNVLRRWRHRWSKAPTILNFQEHQITKCMEIALQCMKIDPKDRPSIGHILDVLREMERDKVHIGQEITYLEDDMLGIEPLELHFIFKLNKEMSWSVKLTNRTKAYFAFMIETPGKQYVIRPDKGIVPQGNEYLIQITLQPQETAPQVIENAEKITVQSTKVSESLRIEDITKLIFDKVAGKFVDEVDLMVVYEPTKPQENSKSRENTNIPVVEVHEAKLETIDYKDIDSSMRGYCTEQTELCKFCPPQIFSQHYPTNTTFLGKASRAVDVTRGTMGSLLDMFGKLVKEDYNLGMNMKSDIQSFSEDLAKIHKDLPNVGKLDGVEIWVDEVREMSYIMEDMVDNFVVHIELDYSGSGFREMTRDGLKYLENGTTSGRQIADVIIDIKNQVNAMVDRQKKYNFDVNNVIANETAKAPIDPRMAIYINKKHLVGMEGRTDEIIRLFEEDGDVSKQEVKIVSIIGLGGLGKTTLAKAVYEKLKEQYHYKAFVPVGQNPNVKKVLINILIAVGTSAPDWEVWQLRDKLEEFLQEKRYFIVIDDIWDTEAWGLITSAFPRNTHGSKVITTTRIESVALACCDHEKKYVYKMKPLSEEDSRRLFLRRIFGPGKDCPDAQKNSSTDILRRCGGMPLAINSIASLLVDEPDSTWDYVRKTLGAMFEGNDLENMKQILDLSYTHLPDHLKTCLLYVCIYPEDGETYKFPLLQKWTAEGFVDISTNSRLVAEDVAEVYFKDLINRCMIQPEKIGYNNEVLSCSVHDIILDLMRSRSTKENFNCIHVVDTGNIQPVSLGYNDEGLLSILQRSGSHIRSQQSTQRSGRSCLPRKQHFRSVLLYGISPVPSFLEFKHVRVLHIELESFSMVEDLGHIRWLLLLRYLMIICRVPFKSTSGCERELKLPKEIGELQQLETMHLVGVTLKNYPSDIVSLAWLSHLSLAGSFVGVVLPDRIHMMQSLRTLEGVNVFGSSEENIKGMSKLTNLRKLWISLDGIGQATNNGRMDALHSSISMISASLMILTFRGGWRKKLDVSCLSRTLFPRGSCIQELDLGALEFQRCPEWICHLRRLYMLTIRVREVADGMSIVAELPSLVYFKLEISMGQEEKEESVVISGTGSGAFQELKHLRFWCKKASLSFEAGAMPKLEQLYIWLGIPYTREQVAPVQSFVMTPRILPAGIQHLPAPTLEKIILSVYCNDLGKVEGSQDYSIDQYREGFRKHKRKLRPMLRRAFTPHHPDAHVQIIFYDPNEDDTEEARYNEDFWGVD